jgi:ribosomal-protein-alanine N-acetyltransferase
MGQLDKKFSSLSRIVIRKFDVEDLEAVLALERNSMPKTPYSRRTLLFYSVMYPDSFLVYTDGSRILGCVIFELDGHVLSIAVDPSSRRKGIGSALMKEVFRKAKQPWVEVKSNNIDAQRFYENLGFRQKGIIKNYYKTGDGLIMVYDKKNYLNEQ